ncbi:hypothetical protein ALC60_02026 [Trachymyrmex zeteki]|uniref:Uncharacterized protein n=1 Tax=Mycetomoellerius zeteki TaxID=64791 RepID=A0A151XF06_9HYME|nr:hypothetical protein ALC60_02026 [Trachymyrmex zeteki]
MSQSTCTKCKRFISRKHPCAFCDADNGLRPSDDCVPVDVTGDGHRLERILEIFNARMAEFDEMFQRLGDVESMTGRLAVVTDGLSDLVAMGARQVILEERFARLEGKVIIGPAISADGSHALPDKLSANFERIINEQRDYELIVFGSQ